MELHQREIKQRIDEYTSKEQYLLKDREDLRVAKDRYIFDLESRYEVTRKSFEIEINRLKIIVNQNETIILDKEGLIMSLEERI